eukprot:scaffold10849_cov64-Cylindrotheca_fusiformis.AAC.1
MVQSANEVGFVVHQNAKLRFLERLFRTYIVIECCHWTRQTHQGLASGKLNVERAFLWMFN